MLGGEKVRVDSGPGTVSTNPSDQSRVKGPCPLRLAVTVALPPGQIAEFGDEPHRLVMVKLPTVGGDDAARLLPAMLERVERHVGDLRRPRNTAHPHHSALVVKVIVVVVHVGPFLKSREAN